MRCSHVCTVALAFIQVLTALALRPSSDHDDRSITKSGNLRNKDTDQAHTKDLMSLREKTSTMASKRNANTNKRVPRIPGSQARYSLSVSERSLLTDLAKTGFRLVWDYMDIAYASYIAFCQTTELWANITANAQGKWRAEKEVRTLDITYGSLKLSIAGLIDAISWELVAEFAAEMLVLSRILGLLAFKLILFAGWAAFVITLAIAAQVLHTIKPQQLVAWP